MTGPPGGWGKPGDMTDKTVNRGWTHWEWLAAVARRRPQHHGAKNSALAFKARKADFEEYRRTISIALDFR